MYARIISETKIDTNAPRSAVIDGSTVCGQLPEDYLNSIGWYRLEETPMPEPREGYHFEARYAYDSAEAPTRVVRSWAEVQDPPPPPRSLSKRKLYRALGAAGIWEGAKSYMESAGCWEDWQYATTLDEDDPLIVAAVAALKQSLGLTDEQVEAILAASVAE
ncbi:MAG: hypothetical protein IIX99_04840 [Oscillospiraceae bacterium]|nr:hypothetical protein [Oscillospiraceae bacterium]